MLSNGDSAFMSRILPNNGSAGGCGIGVDIASQPKTQCMYIKKGMNQWKRGDVLDTNEIEDSDVILEKCCDLEWWDEIDHEWRD